MCGIAGFYDTNADFTINKDFFSDILIHMENALKKRGPNGHGYQLYPNCGLSHTRLSIIDLQAGTQPMTRIINGCTYTIIYNGEIYNCNELKSALLKQNVDIFTHSDTELLLLSYITFGPQFVQNVDGIFAFAIYDENHKTLTLYRDSFGVKPLFYTCYDGTYVFGSEPKSIFCFPGINAILDKEGLNEILTIGPARNQGSGIFKGFNELLPGTYMTLSPFGVNSFTYFRLTSRPHMDSYEKTLEKTRFLITDAIKRQMVSDVPICTFLSGGIDSSLVTAVCSNLLREKNQKLSTFSFDFAGNDQFFKATSFQPSSDKPYVDMMIKYSDTIHTYLECSNLTQADFLYNSVDAHDFPCMADVDSSLLFFCSKVAKSHRVVLTGECADEIFGGYPWFHREEMLNCNTFPWTPDLSPRKAVLNNDIVELLHMDEYADYSYKKAVSEIPPLPGEDATETNRRIIGYLNIRYFMQTLLNRMDRTSMYSGLEARVPFADKRLVDYVFNVPWSMKCKDGLVKGLLRNSVKGLLPDEILFRKKSPYPKTYNPIYEKILKDKLFCVLSSDNAPVKQLINETAVKSLALSPANYGAPWYGQLMAGPQMIAYILQINYFLEKYHVTLKL